VISFLLLTDGRFPTGGHAHSGGLEAAVGDGLDTAALPAFVATRLEVVAAADASLAVAAQRAARAHDLDLLLRLDDEAEARLPSHPLRRASRRLGSQLLRTASAVWPDAEPVERYRASSSATPRAVAFGVVAAAAGLSEVETATALLYDDAATVAAAAVRLLPLDPAAAGRLLVELEPAIERLAAEAVARAGDAAGPPIPFAPAYEVRSLAHAAQEVRLFAS
jgi:urease accessory protein